MTGLGNAALSAGSLTRMLQPKSVAVIGASEKANYGGRLMGNLIKQGYAGAIYPVNPGSSDIFGYRCYGSLTDIQEEIDLAVVIVKAELTEAMLRQCEEKRVGSVLIISAGFREQGTPEGAARELMLREWSERTGIPVCGPNCLGIGSSASRLWAASASSIGEDLLPSSGSVALLSHSGATAFGPLLNRGKDYGVSYRYIVSTGNETCVSMIGFADWMLDDPEVRVIGLFIEGIHDGPAFGRLADKALQLGKPIVALKIGESEVGRKAAASHTASLTGDRQVFEAFCRQKGVLLAKDYDEFLNLARCFDSGRELAGNRLAVLSHSGGIGGFVGDKLGSAGMEVPPLSQACRDRIDALLTGFGTSGNPLDLSGAMQSEHLVRIMDILESEEQLDGYVFATHGKPPFLERLGLIYGKLKKPLYLVWTGSQEDPALARARELGLPIFFLPDKLAVTLQRLRQFRAASERPAYEDAGAAAAVEFEPLDVPKDAAGTLSEYDGKRLLRRIGIASPAGYYLERNGDLDALLRSVPFDGRKYAAKIVSRTITHKSDRGGVALRLGEPETVAHFYENQVLRSSDAGSIDGMLLEEMIGEKVELILGSAMDPQFGPVVMVGLGGIYTELFRLVSWRVAPFDREEARRLLEEIQGLPSYLQGYRNTPKMDVEALLDTVSAFSHWVYRLRERVRSVEINPLAVLPEGQGVCALDCVITLSGSSSGERENEG